MKRKKTVLVVVAHADDLEFLCAGMVARMIDEFGYDVYEYILTDNSKGSYRLQPTELIEVSAKEAVEAGKILGLKEVRLEGYADGDLNEAHPNVLREKVMRMIREIKADIVMSFDPWAAQEEHPDHRMTAMATLDAASFSANPLFYPAHPHPAYPVTEAYWFAKTPWQPNCIIDISKTIDKKIAALLAHDCQMWLTVDALVQEAKVLGIELPALEALDQTGFAPLIDAAVREHCSAAGAPKGYAYAETFRYESLSGLDKRLGLNAVQRDFE